MPIVIQGLSVYLCEAGQGSVFVLKKLLHNHVDEQSIKAVNFDGCTAYREVKQMAIASLSPSSVLASPIQVNPQVKTDQQISVPQVAEDAQKAAKAVQTDTITISPQALKMADEKNVAGKKTPKPAEATKKCVKSLCHRWCKSVNRRRNLVTYMQKKRGNQLTVSSFFAGRYYIRCDRSLLLGAYAFVSTEESDFGAASLRNNMNLEGVW